MIQLSVKGEPAPQVSHELSTECDLWVAAGAMRQVLPDNEDRLASIIQNLGTGPVRVGDAMVSGDRGVLLQPGEAFTIHSSASLFCFNLGPADNKMSIAYLSSHVVGGMKPYHLVQRDRA